MFPSISLQLERYVNTNCDVGKWVVAEVLFRLRNRYQNRAPSASQGQATSRFEKEVYKGQYGVECWWFCGDVIAKKIGSPEPIRPRNFQREA